MDIEESLIREYHYLFEQQVFVEKELDYSILQSHIPFLEKLAQVNNSGITVFDLFKKQHVYASYNFSELFGYDNSAIESLGNEYFDSRVQPEDLIELFKRGIAIMRFYLKMPVEERANYKFVNEYRVLGKDHKYVRVIEQHQVLEIDNYGNVWLSLGVIDVSPDQSPFQDVKTQIFNYKTGKIFSPTVDIEKVPDLTKREIEILNLIKEGFLSKEISDKLSISVHTVNTHRQKILKKLEASNSMEAIRYASEHGLI